MKLLSPASRRDDSGTRRVPRMLSSAAVAMAILILSMRPGPTSHARAGDEQPAQAKPAGGSLHPDVMAQYERMLAGLDRRLSGLTKLVLEDATAVEKSRNEAMDLSIKARTAEAEYLNAKLSREVAEIAVKEYVEGIAVQDLAVAEGEVKLARSDVDRQRRNTAEAKERLARISAAADNSAFGLNIVYSYTDRVTSAELSENAAALTVETAESKRKVLADYTIPKQTKVLSSEVSKARSDELAKQAIWEIMKAKAEVARKGGQGKDLPEDRKRILALIDQAIPLEEKLRASLMEASKTEPPASNTNEIVRLLNEMGALVDRAEAVRDIGDFARLKPQVQQAARRFKVSSVK